MKSLCIFQSLLHPEQWYPPEAQQVIKKLEALIEHFDFETAAEQLDELTRLLDQYHGDS